MKLLYKAKWLAILLSVPAIIIGLSLLFVQYLETPLNLALKYQPYWLGLVIASAVLTLVPKLLHWQPKHISIEWISLEKARSLYKDFSSIPLAIPGVMVLTVFTMMAIFPHWFIPRFPMENGWILHRLAFGARPMVELVLKATILATGIGASLGVISGYFGKNTDRFIMFLVELILAFPTLIFMMTILMVTDNSSHALWLIVALGIAQTTKLVRSEAISLKERDYIQAAQATGASDLEILFRHLLTNLSPVLLVQATTFSGQVVLIHSSLTFLGVVTGGGWGWMLGNLFRAQGSLAMVREPELVITLGISITLLITALNIVGTAIGEVLIPGRKLKPKGFNLLEKLPGSVKLVLILALGVLTVPLYMVFLLGNFDVISTYAIWLLPLVMVGIVIAYIPDLKDWEIPSLSAIFGDGRGSRTKIMKILSRFRKNYIGVLGVFLILLFAITAISPQLFLPESLPVYTPLELRDMNRGPSAQHPLGVTFDGEDVRTILVTGTRPVMIFGVTAAMIATLIGGSLGALAGFKGGAFDRGITLITELILSFPSLFMMLTVLIITGDNQHRLWVIGIYGIATTAKIMRSETLSLRTREYISAAKAVGCGDLQILFNHVLVNAAPLAIIQFTLFTGQAILLDAYVNFLGISGAAGWAGAIADSISRFRLLAVYREPWLVLSAGGCLTVLIMAFNMVGQSLRDALDFHH